MKKIIVLSLAFLPSWALWAQTTSIKVEPAVKKYSQHEHAIQYQTNLADLIYLSPSLEVAFRVLPKNFVGAKLSVPFLVEGYDGIYKTSNNGIRLEVFDKFFFAGEGTTSSNYYYFLRFGSQLSVINLNYDRADWFNFYEDGLPYLTYETRSFRESVYRLNVSLAVGFQQVFDSFYLELYGGLIYGGALNRADLEAPQTNRDDYFNDNFSYWASNHVLPAVGVSFGFGQANRK